MSTSRATKRRKMPRCPYYLRSFTRSQPSGSREESGSVSGEVAEQPTHSFGEAGHETQTRTIHQTRRATRQRRTHAESSQPTQRESGQETQSADQGRRGHAVSTPSAATGRQTHTAARSRGTRERDSGEATRRALSMRARQRAVRRREASRDGGSRRAQSTSRPIGLWPESSTLEFTEEAAGGTDDRLGMWTGEKLLAKYTIPMTCPPEEVCSICIGSLREPSGLYSEEEDEDESQKHGNKDCAPSDGCSLSDTVEFTLCHHVFHRACASQLVKHARHHLQCPYCKTIHGVRVGNQPTSGQMRVWCVPESLPGHPDCGTFVIKYSFQGGIQTQQHPNPGQPYYALDFPRIAYVPASDKGKKVLQLLREAWRRRLIFTVGTSATSGLSNVITWSDIHHKTNSCNNYNGHGYPDEHYLDNVLGELWAVGVTEDTLDADAGGDMG